MAACERRADVSSMKRQHSQSRDRGLISEEPYEIEYIHRQFPNHSHEEVHQALKAAKAQLKGSENRDRIMQIMREKLK
jgi:hypothetical protein